MSPDTVTAGSTPPARVAAPAVPHPRASRLLAFGIVGMVMCQLLAPFAWWRAQLALKDVDEHPDRWSNRGVLQAARVCGVIGTVVLVLAVLDIAFFDVVTSGIDAGSVLENTLQTMFSSSAVVYAMIAIGLNLHFGYTGLLNFGQAGFVAVGAYGMAISVTYYGWSMWLGIGVGLLAAVVLALLLGFPTLRLRSDYLAIVTIAASEIIRLVVNAPELRDWSGGVDGLNGFNDAFTDLNPFTSGADYGFGPLVFKGNTLWFILCGWTTVLLVAGITYLLVNSPWGRVVKAIREDEDAVRALGKNAYVYKMQALVIGGVIGGLGGVLLALAKGSVNPQDFQTQVTFIAYAVVIIGGMARVIGPVVGSMILWGILAFTGSFLREATAGADPVIPRSILEAGDVGVVRLMLVGLLLVLLMAFRPQGIFGKREEMALDDS